ncbi:MAG: CRISPR-associated protein Csx19 [Lachnospiraceae bacterium]|nr:CRISPR-associated protein Csx19 [Lachnospiraceae bacterium]
MFIEEYMEEARETVTAGYVVAALTDEYLFDTWPMKSCSLEGKAHKVLEIRIFNQTCELKLFRTDVFRSFSCRRITAEEESRMDYFDQEQYLDIDTKQSRQGFEATGTVRATGGGSYHLPFPTMTDVKIRIRYYLAKGDTGQARIRDWRLVDLVKGGEKNASV